MKLGFVFALCAVALSVLPVQATAPSSLSPQTVPPVPYEPIPDQPFYTAAVLFQTPETTGTVRLAELVASYFNRDVEEILALHTEEIGFGSIAKALYTAVEADITLEQVLEMHLAQDLGWGEIRQNLELDPGMPHASLAEIIAQKRGQDPDWVPPGLRNKDQGMASPGQGNKNVAKANKKKSQSNTP